MANLTGINDGIFNRVHLVNDTTGNLDEVRQLFLQGSIENSIPSNPTANQVLSIPALLPQLNAKQTIANSYNISQIDNIIANNPGPKGAKGELGASVTGPKGVKGDIGQSGQKGDLGATGIGQKGEPGENAVAPQSSNKGDKGEPGTNGQKGVKGDAGINGQGVKGESGTNGAKGQKGEEASSSLSPSAVAWVSEGSGNITQNSNGLNSMRFTYDAALQGRTAAGAYEDCLIPRGQPNDSTILKYGYNGLSIKHNSGSVAMNLTTDLRCELKNHLNLSYSDPEIQLRGTSASDEPTILFGTPASGHTGYKSAIRAHGLNSSGRSQLGFLVSNTTADVITSNPDTRMLVDAAGVGIGLPIGNTPESLLDVRDSGMCFSRTSGTGSTSMIFTGEGAAGNYPSSGRFTYAQMIVNSAWQGGEIAFWTKPWNSTTLTRALTIKDDQKVGIGTHAPSSLLHVNGSFAATSKAFLIDFPGKPGWKLKHCCVETNSCGGLLYKYQLVCAKNANEFPLPEYVSIIGKDFVCVCSPHMTFGQCYAYVENGKLHVHCSKAMTVNVIVTADRCDPDAVQCFDCCEIPPEETTE